VGRLLFIAGSILAPLSPNVFTLIVSRTLLGVAIGFTSVTAPVYVSELAPPQSRGMLIGLYQFALTGGIALADLAGYWLAGEHAWRWMFGLGCDTRSSFSSLLVLTVPESPRWLVAHGRSSEAETVSEGRTPTKLAQAMLLADIRASLTVTMEERWGALWTPTVRKALLLPSDSQCCNRSPASTPSSITVRRSSRWLASARIRTPSSPRFL
jgi:MFS family permease